MTIEYSFFDPTVDEFGAYDREYNAEQFTNYFGALVETGIMRQQEQELKVTADGTTMNTTIGTGVCYVEGRFMKVKAPYLLTHDTESVGVNRIDRVVVRLDLRIEGRYVLPFVKKGAASTNPIPPPLQRDNEVYEVSLAQASVIGGRSYLAANDVTDERADESLCGWATSKIMPNYSDATLQAVLTQVEDNDTQIKNHEKNVINHIAYGVATGTNAKVVTVNIPLTSLIDGLAVSFKNNNENTGAVTLNVNGKGAKPVIKADGRILVSGDLTAGSIYTVRYNSTTGTFILQGEGGGAIIEKNNVTTGDEVLLFNPLSADTSDSIPKKVMSFDMNVNGSVRLKYILRVWDYGTAHLIIYKNGLEIKKRSSTSETGIAYSDDVGVKKGDVIDVYIYEQSTTHYSAILTSFTMSINFNEIPVIYTIY